MLFDRFTRQRDIALFFVITGPFLGPFGMVSARTHKLILSRAFR
jgi:hypothetical protein